MTTVSGGIFQRVNRKKPIVAMAKSTPERIPLVQTGE